MRRRSVRWISKQKLSKADILAEGEEEALESVPSAPAEGKKKSKGEEKTPEKGKEKKE